LGPLQAACHLATSNMGCISSKEEAPSNRNQAPTSSNRGRKYQPVEKEDRSQHTKDVAQNFSQVYKVDRLLGTGKEGVLWAAESSDHTGTCLHASALQLLLACRSRKRVTI